MNKPIISDSELMAEKLGIIVLCENCGERLIRTSVVRVPLWTHEKTNLVRCDFINHKGNIATVATVKKEISNMNIGPI